MHGDSPRRNSGPDDRNVGYRSCPGHVRDAEGCARLYGAAPGAVHRVLTPGGLPRCALNAPFPGHRPAHMLAPWGDTDESSIIPLPDPTDTGSGHRTPHGLGRRPTGPRPRWKAPPGPSRPSAPTAGSWVIGVSPTTAGTSSWNRTCRYPHTWCPPGTAGTWTWVAWPGVAEVTRSACGRWTRWSVRPGTAGAPHEAGRRVDDGPVSGAVDGSPGPGTFYCRFRRRLGASVCQEPRTSPRTGQSTVLRPHTGSMSVTCQARATLRTARRSHPGRIRRTASPAPSSPSRC
ncbi:hypothetical protein STAFG_8897 [Streptomyces afghaniensis 772]|uniref:Uncharacterized protein n=1 Tax=Streptomyces afghaniensis 772 TaxID=1283301 RepID=S4MKS7_9ACTN|nr:hypothetical protein STAFG_8897 [Streptomyces afghaniensis 772]